MSSDTTPPTWAFHLRAEARHKAIVQRVIEAHRLQGIPISMNRALCILIERGAIPDADTEDEARTQIEHHWAECQEGCNRETIKCPEGWRLRDAWLRITRNRTATPTPARAAGAFRQAFARRTS